MNVYRTIMQDGVKKHLMILLRESLLRGVFLSIDIKLCNVLVKPAEGIMEKLSLKLVSFRRKLNGLFSEVPYAVIVGIVHEILTKPEARAVSYWTSLLSKSLKSIAVYSHSRVTIAKGLSKLQISQVCKIYQDTLQVLQKTAAMICRIESLRSSPVQR